MAAIAWFFSIVGAAILFLWSFLVITSRVPEIEEGDRAIWFHIAAEALLGATLLIAGLSLAIASSGWPRLLGGVAAGGLVYSTINSSGYYASRGQWGPVGAFGLLAAAALWTIVTLVGGA